MSTTEWVARRAKVSRVTGCRRFSDRHALVTAKMMSEGRHLTARVADAMASAQTPARHAIDLSTDKSTRDYLHRTLVSMITGLLTPDPL